MREDAFRAILARSLGARSVDSYVAYARRVEAAMGIDLDEAALDEPFTDVSTRLQTLGAPPASVANCLSAVRSYVRFRNGADEPMRAAPRSPSQVIVPDPSVERPDFIRNASILGLLRMQAQVLNELRDRGIVRTGNGPVGDYAELLFARAFGWALAGNSAGHYDALDEARVRYQIKARRLSRPDASRQLGAIRRLPDHGFDMLAAVLFDDRFLVQRAAIMPYDVAVAIARRTDHTNSWRVVLSDRVWTIEGVDDVTIDLRRAQDAMSA